jgi:hypothetical protein
MWIADCGFTERVPSFRNPNSAIRNSFPSDFPARTSAMSRPVALLPLTLLLGIIFLGCEPTPVASGPAPPPGSAATAPAPPATASSGQAPLPPETKFGVFAGDVNDLAARPNNPQPTSPATPGSEPATERVKAQAGVGAKGRSLDAYQGGLLVTPAKAYFAAKERIAFEQAFYGQYRLYRATEDPPKDYADLKTKVLDPYQIKLPQLPQGHKYVWDPEKEELQVERPKPPQ